MDEEIEEQTLSEETLLNMESMLASLHTQEDLDIVMNEGISETCFVDAENHWGAFKYIKRCIQSGKTISHEYVRRKYKIDLPRSEDNPKTYAVEVVTATARSQADLILAEAEEALKGGREELYEAMAEARNKLRNLVGPLTGPLAAANGGVVRYDKAGSMKMPPAQKWLVRGVVPDNWPTFFYGAGGSAKSYLAVLLAFAVATGKQFLGTPATGRKVLYLDWEMDEETFRARVNRVARGMKVSIASGVPNLTYRKLIKPLKEHLDDIIEQVETEGLGLVIIDSFGFSMTGMDTSKQPDVTAQMARIAQIPCAVVIIDHIGKHGKGEEGPFGSIYKHAASRWMWWCQAVSKQPSPDGEVKPGIFVRMWNAKHNIAAQQEDIYLHIVWDDEFDANVVSMKKKKPEEVPESLTRAIKAPEKKKARDELSATDKRILLSIDDAPKAAPDGIADKKWIVEDSGFGHTTVEKVLDYLESVGEVRKERVVPPKGQKKGRGANRYQYLRITKTVSKEDVDVSQEMEEV